MSAIDLLVAAGSPSVLGMIHGSAYRDDIAAYARDRVDLSRAGTALSVADVLDLAEQMLPAHEAYDAGLFEEMCSLADAAGITPAEALIVGGYTDFIDTVRSVAGTAPHQDACTAVITSDAGSDGAGFLAQTWDMHASATAHVFMFDVRPTDAPRALVFTTHGTLGQIGMNEAGIAVGINNLTMTDGAIGVTWPFAVRRALAATDFDTAVAAILDAPLAGGHSFLVRDASGRGAMIEASATASHVTQLDQQPLIHTNHCLAPTTRTVEAPRPEDLVASSLIRLEQAAEMLAGTGGPVTADGLMSMLSDERSICRYPTPPFDYETSGAVVMRPATRELWACKGRPSEHEFERFEVTAS